MTNAFLGENGLKKFLNPHSSYITPLVELPKELNPYTDQGIHISLKMYSHLPLLNVKSLAAWGLLENTDIKDKQLVESSS